MDISWCLGDTGVGCPGVRVSCWTAWAWASVAPDPVCSEDSFVPKKSWCVFWLCVAVALSPPWKPDNVFGALEQPKIALTAILNLCSKWCPQSLAPMMPFLPAMDPVCVEGVLGPH